MFKMLPIISMLALSSVYADDVVKVGGELDVMGLSDHSNHYPHYNQVNPGLGVDLTFEVNPQDHAEIVVSAGQYQDSYHLQAKYMLIGPRWLVFGDYDTFHGTFGAEVGMLNGSGNHGFIFIPYVSVGWKWIDLCVIADYAKDNNGVPNSDGSINKENCSTSMVGVFLRFRLLSFGANNMSWFGN